MRHGGRHEIGYRTSKKFDVEGFLYPVERTYTPLRPPYPSSTMLDTVHLADSVAFTNASPHHNPSVVDLVSLLTIGISHSACQMMPYGP